MAAVTGFQMGRPMVRMDPTGSNRASCGYQVTECGQRPRAQLPRNSNCLYAQRLNNLIKSRHEHSEDVPKWRKDALWDDKSLRQGIRKLTSQIVAPWKMSNFVFWTKAFDGPVWYLVIMYDLAGDETQKPPGLSQDNQPLDHWPGELNHWATQMCGIPMLAALLSAGWKALRTDFKAGGEADASVGARGLSSDPTIDSAALQLFGGSAGSAMRNGK